MKECTSAAPFNFDALQSLVGELPYFEGAEHKVNCGMPQENFGGSPWGPHPGPA